jgi:hypothetical protein
MKASNLGFNLKFLIFNFHGMLSLLAHKFLWPILYQALYGLYFQ